MRYPLLLLSVLFILVGCEHKQPTLDQMIATIPKETPEQAKIRELHNEVKALKAELETYQDAHNFYVTEWERQKNLAETLAAERTECVCRLAPAEEE